MADILPTGTQVRCPRKRHLIGVTNTPITSGDVLRFKVIDFEPGQDRVAGERAECKLCGSAYIVKDKIYTSAGWKPSEPSLEPVPLQKR